MAERLRLDASVVSTTQIMGQSVYKASYFSALHGRRCHDNRSQIDHAKGGRIRRMPVRNRPTCYLRAY